MLMFIFLSPSPSCCMSASVALHTKQCQCRSWQLWLVSYSYSHLLQTHYHCFITAHCQNHSWPWVYKDAQFWPVLFLFEFQSCSIKTPVHHFLWSRSWSCVHCIPQGCHHDASVPTLGLPLLHDAHLPGSGQSGEECWSEDTEITKSVSLM